MHQPALPDTPAYIALRAHYEQASQWHMRDLFAQDQQRFKRFSLDAAGLFLDYSKNRIDSETLALLTDLVRQRGLEQSRQRMFDGEKINTTEQRAVLHTALRAPRNQTLIVDGQNLIADVHVVLDKMRGFAQQVRSGQWLGASGKKINTIVNIGIGGSFLGPKMAHYALRSHWHPDLAFHFVSNVDANALNALLPTLDAHTTLFIVASKTFGTAETMLNAHAARAWTIEHCGEDSPASHFVAVSTNEQAVIEFGISQDNIFGFWDWVGGRYSVWSAVGLALMVAVGAESFDEFLAGAHAMDRHFQEAPLEQNMPVILAILGIWYRNFFGFSSLSIAPYWQDLQYLPGYLQQLDMESNGKQVSQDGVLVDYATAPVIWGDVGTNGQHAFFQLLHQGTEPIPVDFITVAAQPEKLAIQHTALLANCLAQSAALMQGKTSDQVRAEKNSEALVPHKTFPGNRPSNTLLLPAMTPASLGALIALYEHKTFVQGIVWGINSFDQWGVELGKALAKDVELALAATASTENPTHAAQDSSTAGLIHRIRSTR